MQISLILASVGVATFLSGASFLTIIFGVDPNYASRPVKALFFISLALFLIGFLTLASYPIKRRFFPEENPQKLIKNSFRQGFLTALWFTIFLILNIESASLVILAALAIILASIEYYYFHRKLKK